MKSPIQSSLVAFMLTSASSSAAAFTIQSAASTATSTSTSTFRAATKLNVHAANSESDAMMMINQANACAHSDTCSIEEAEEYLNEMLHLQSDCVSGSLTNGLICDDILFPSEVISGLRDKIQKQVEMSNQGSTFQVGWNPIFLTVLALYLSSGMLSLAHNNPDSFTMQEWMYAFQGGYLDDLLSQYLKYGGLSPIAPEAVGGVDDGSTFVSALTLQEWWWSIRDGYLGNMISESQNHGGFLTLVEDGGNADDLLLTTPLTSQEWSNAARDGYLADMITHYMRNGGL